MTRQSIMVIFVMLLTLISAVAFTQYKSGEREDMIRQQKAQQLEIERAASAMPRPAPEMLQIDNIPYHLVSAPRGQITFKWLGLTSSNIGIYSVLGDSVKDAGMIAIKHDDGTYSFYLPSQTAASTPTTR